MTHIFVSLTKSRNGQPMIDLSAGGCRHHLFGLHDVKNLRKYLEGSKAECILYSSSTNFPEEVGASAYYDVRAVIQEALGQDERPKDLVLISKTDIDRIAQLAKDKGFHEDLKALDIQLYGAP